ncbi:MAG: alanine--tRNA ligase [Actinomycetota bacterium]|nr:alanine--tRNA ligase [Actinomycetota bacterium]
MESDRIRTAFLDFFREKSHRIVPSSSLIPDDPTLLLTAAGMVQFKPYFLGQKKPEFPRAASVQKCARTTDIEVVGLTARHLSFFEMLGNFSFGDYYKKEACAWAWELATGAYGLEPELLWVTVFETDDEAFEVWRDHVGVPANKIVRRGAEDNFWTMGVAGPCGPCSEMFYDRGPKYGDVDGFQDGDRIVEFWNLVFMQNLQDDDGTIVGELPNKNIDTGSGFERVAMILQKKDSIWDTDVLRGLIAKAESLTGRRYGEDETTDVSLRVMADHARFASFLIGDGVFPSNEERGYVLRRIIRRAVRHARMLGTEKPVMETMSSAVIEMMGGAYPDLVGGRSFIAQTIVQEEESFTRTLRQGLTLLEGEMKTAKKAISGDVAFKLHDTYGFPIDLTVEIAREAGLEIERAAFERLMDEQRERARSGRAKHTETAASEALKDIAASHGATKFVGYERDRADASVLALVRGGAPVDAVAEGDEVEIVLDASPFYPEGGGQIGDSGTIAAGEALLEITDTQKGIGDLIVHRGRVARGELRVGEDAAAAVDIERRVAVMRSHSATHVLHWALRNRLGPHARQAGSLVAPGRLRFDFPHTASVPRDVLQEVEKEVNDLLLGDGSVRAYETTMEYAKNIGAMALFGEKYGAIVRVVEIGDYSVELCGGTHVAHTAQVGPLTILGEASIGANLRRIEALTGTEALAGFRKDRAVLEHIAMLLHATPDEAPDKVQKMLDDLKAAQQTLEKSKQQGLRSQATEIVQKAERIGDASLVVTEVTGLRVDELQKLAVSAREALQDAGVVVLVSASDGRAGIVAAVTRDLAARGISAKALIAQAARAIGGGAGGKDDVATGGGGKPEGVQEAARLAADEARRALGA